MSEQKSQEKSQEFIDREQMIAGIDFGRMLINAAMMNPQNVKKEELMDQLQSLMTPTRFKDLSPQDLRKMVFDKYVEAASIAMMKDINNNHYEVKIPLQHASVAQDLVKHWKEKEFVVSYDTCKEDGSKITTIRLTW